MTPGFRPDFSVKPVLHNRAQRVEPHNESCNFRIALASGSHGQGLGAEATRLIVGYGFETLGLHRISLEVLSVQSAGQTRLREGRLRRRGRAYLFGGCGIHDPGPRCGAAGAVSPHLVVVLELFQDEPDGLVADTRHGCPDVCEAERGGCAAQDVIADTLLLGPGSLSRSRAISEDGVGAGDHDGEVAEPGPWV